MPIQETHHEQALAHAEDLFVALASAPGMAYYLGQFHGAPEEDLRAVFGVAMAAVRRSQSGGVSATGNAQSAPGTSAAPTDDAASGDYRPFHRAKAAQAALHLDAKDDMKT